jgi:hypothetical protein
LYRFHPAAWDWLCWTPFPWFDRLLVKYAEMHPAAIEAEIQRLPRSTLPAVGSPSRFDDPAREKGRQRG